jgi:hypothetical protein
MDKLDLDSALSLLIDEMEGDQGDQHEILMCLRQMLDTMWAEGLPVPDNLAKMEATLSAEFEAEAKQ